MLHNADCLDVLKHMKTNSVDSIVCDPPYGINILDSHWDKELPINEIWQECNRVLQPGGHILAFSSARLYHHLAISMEQVGFETFNMLTWIYNSGLPKGRSLSREFDRSYYIPKPDNKFRLYLRNAIKKSPYKITELERICGTSGMFSHYLGKSQPSYPSTKVWKILKRTLKLDSTYDLFFKDLEKKRKELRSKKEKSEANGLYKDTFTKPVSIFEPTTDLAKKWDGWKYGKQTVRPCIEPIYFGQKTPLRPMIENVKEYGVGALNFNGCKIKGLDNKERTLSSAMLDKELHQELAHVSFTKTLSSFSDEAFFISKPSHKERAGISHPTLKPVSLMQKLVKLITPPKGVCLDPFMGSGTTGVACKLEGFQFIGIEREKDFFDLAKKRILNTENSVAS